jgi:hypothetical protein
MSMEQEQPRRRVPMVPSPGKQQPMLRPGAITPVKEEGRHPQLYAIGPVGNIGKAIATVMRDVGTIPKNGYNAFHKYHYVRMEDLLHAVTPLMGAAGMAIIQSEVDIKQVENRVAVTYEFTIVHESGETWPPARQTGMSNARDSKGNWDDKCLNKCHTSARKYFLSALFQVPAGDFDDADETPPEKADANRRVPGPVQKERLQSAPGTRESVPGQSTKPTEVVGPHKINLGPGAGADQWGGAYIRAIGKAKSKDEIIAWDQANDATLQMLSEQFPKVYEMLTTAVQSRLAELAPADVPSGMPDPKTDAQEAMNWAASQLAQFREYKAAEMFWNEFVAPHEGEFDEVDWSMLLEEWKRTENRLAQDDTGGQA